MVRCAEREYGHRSDQLGVALAVVDLARQKNRIAIVNGAGTTRLTNENCTPNSIHYAWDTYAMANSTARAIVENGGKRWYFLTADYAFGQQIERDVTQVVRSAGGEVIGTSRHPFNASDFSSYIVKAQGSGAQIIGLANGGGDTINAIKAAAEFGIDPAKQNLAGLAVFITDVNGVGLKAAQGCCRPRPSIGISMSTRAPGPGASSSV